MKHSDLRDLSLTPLTDELRRNWLSDEESLREHGANPPGWSAFEDAMELCHSLELKLSAAHFAIEIIKGK